MNHHTSSSTNRTVRTLISCLLSYLLLISQLTPIALAFSNSSSRSSAISTDNGPKSRDVAPPEATVESTSFAPKPAPLNVEPATLAPNITATKVDTYPSSPGSALPGETIRYTITINNSGPDPATNVTLSDTVDVNTAIVGTPKSTPIGFPDAYSVIGNVRIQVPDGASDLLANDRDPDTDTNAGLTITTLAGDNSAPFSGTSANGGQVTATTGNGAFEYNPAPGFTGTDTFTYIATDADGNTNPVTVTLTVTGLIWFVNSAAGGGGDGRLTSPFNCLVGAGCFDPVAADDPGDNIFLFSGNYTGGLTFLANQKLIGAGASATLATIAGVTVPTFSDALPATGGVNPVITTVAAATNALTVSAGGITLRGFTIGNTTGAKILGSAFGTLTAGNNTTPDLLLNGNGMALNLTNGTFAATSAFSGVTTTSSTAQGIFLSQILGTVALGSTTVSSSTTQGILVQQSTADINFGNTAVGTGVAGTGGTNAVLLQNNSAGTRTFGTLTIQNINGPANSAFVSSAGGGNTLAGTTNISGVAGTGNGIDIQNLAGGTSVSFGTTTVNKASPGSLVNLNLNSGNVSFLSLGGTNTNGPGLTATENSGSITVTNNAGSLTTTLGPAVSITKAGAPATPITLNFTALSSTNSGTQGVNLDRISGNMTVTTTTVTNSTGTGIQVQNTGAGTVNFGTTSVPGSGNANVDATGTGVFLNANAGNVTFGDLDISPDANERAFQATAMTGTITTTSGDIAATGNVTLDIVGPAGRTPLAMVLNNLDSTNSSGVGVNINLVSGNFTVNDATLATSIQNPTGVGLQVQNTAAGGTMNFGNSNVTGSGGTGVVLGTAANGNAGAITFADLDIAPDSGQRSFIATQNTGNLTITSGTLTTTNNIGVEIIGTSSVTRTPLNVTFTTVAVTGGGVAAMGIVLQNTSTTGAPGGFNVVGTGGTCTFASPAGCSGGRITTTTGGDNNVNAGIGVKLTDANSISLTRMRIDNHPNFAIRGRNVNGFTLQFSVVDGNNGTSSIADVDVINGEDSIRFVDLSGTALIDNCFIGGGFEQNIRVFNDTGTLNRITISNSSVGDLDGAGPGRGVDNTNGDDNILLDARNSGTVLNSTLTNNILNNARGDVIQVNGGISSTMDVVFRLNKVSNNHPNKVVAGGGAVFQSLGNFTYDISCNSFRDSNGIGLNVFKLRPANGQTGGTMSGTIFNNTVGVTGVQNSGAADGASGINVEAQGNGVHTTLIKNNVIRNTGEAGIRTNVIDANTVAPVTVTMNATVIGNVVAEPDPVNSFAGFFAVQGAVPGADANTTLNLKLGNAAVAAEKNNFNDGSAITNDVFLQRAAGAIGAFNLSRAGSAAGTATQVVIDDNTVDGSSVFTDAGIALVAGNPTLPAVVDQTCVPPPLTVPGSDAIPAPPDNMQAAQTAVETSSEPAPQVAAPSNAAPSNNDSITTRPFVSLPRVVTAQQSNTAAPKSATAEPIRIDDDSAPTPRAAKKPRQTDTPPNPNPPTIGPGGTSITWNVGTLPAGQSVTIVFDVQVENPYSGPAQVSNQGSISFGGGGGPVLTDDPSVVGPANPTVTPILVPPDVSINNAKVAEPPSGTTSMLFTVALSSPAGQMITINYNTANGTAVAPGDYAPAVGLSTVFQVGEQVKIIPITVNSDVDNTEVDETFTVTISANSTQANVVGATGTGTITVANPAGTLLISEVRTSGPSGSADEFVEIYNNSDTPHIVAATNGSTGYGVFKMGADCNATPILVGTIPNGTNIPARGHYLLVGSAYSLANYGGTGAAAGNLTMSSDIENDRNVSLFSTTNILALSTTTRFDAVGFSTNTGNVCDLQREGTNLGALLGSTLQYTFFRKECDFVLGPGCTVPGRPKDANDNSVDFLFADTAATLVAGAGQHLGAPGPQNLASPLKRDATILVQLLDLSVPNTSPPNRVRDLTSDPANNSTLGTLLVRRRVINNTGGNVTRLRFRAVELTTAPPPGGIADLRARTSVTQVGVGPVNDAATCAATGSPATAPCTVTVQGLTLETPPAQAMAGGYNSTVSAGTVTLATPLATGASINVQFLLGVQQTGNFRYLIIVEALP
jgi:Big-like domain-containing protein/Calx-beta domain-containing protein